jgi:ribose-phosphate pyrophosphokinase
MLMPNHLIFSTSQYSTLANKIIDLLGADTGHIESKVFPDGERYLRLISEVRNRNVVLVGGTNDDRSTLDLFDLGCAIAANGALSLKIVIPFFGYATMERSVRPGEIVMAKTRARILSAIPLAPMGNQIIMLDLHSEGIPFYFEGAVKTRHLYAKSLILREAKLLGGEKFTLGSVDAGRAKWVESLANDLGVPAGFIYKRRDHDGRVSVAGVNVAVKGHNVVIYDDMIRSGGSLMQAAMAYREAGANEIFAITTHGVFTQGALEKLKNSGLFVKMVCTDSHPAATNEFNNSFLKVVSVADIFANAIIGDLQS